MTPIQIKEWLKERDLFQFVTVKKLDTLDYINSLESRNNELALALIGVMRIIDNWIDDEGYNLSDDPHCHRAIGRADKANKAALKAIEEAKERADLMLIQMRGDCGVCGNRENRAMCNECLDGKDKPLWKYEGLPEVKKR